MGLFILFGFCALLAAKLMLLTKILWTRDCTGISGKTQVIYAIIFAGRYLDIVTTYYTCPISVSLSRIGFTALAYSIVLSIFFFYSDSYQSKYDKFRIELLILPCLVLSLLANYGFDIVEVFWAFSVYLEAVAILPQVYLISRAKRIQSIVYYYISLLAVYKLFDLVDGLARFYADQSYDRISLAAGVVQLMFYCDFFLRDVPLAGDARGSSDDPEAALGSRDAADADKAALEDKRAAKEAEAARSAAPVQAAEPDAVNAQRDGKPMHCNLGEIVLTPAELVKDEKISIVMPGEQEGKTTNDSSIRA